MTRRKGESDPLERIREAQDHRLDPGYFTGGRIDPLLTGSRPNRRGWVLIIGIFIPVSLIIATGGFVGAAWWQQLLIWSFIVLQLAAGITLLRRRRISERSRRGRVA
jgi:hypothetical protein